MNALTPIAVCQDVSKYYGKIRTPAVNEVSLTIERGEIVGIVGESGSGKTTLARVLCGLVSHEAGAVTIDGRDLSQMSDSELWTVIQMVPQDSYGSLNPTLRVQDIVAEPLHYRGHLPWREARRQADEILATVGISEVVAQRTPKEMSGGQRQRVALARALSVRPQLLICDESTSALDVSVQAQILNLIQRLQEEYQFAVLFVTHDIDVVRYLSDRVVVMQDGRIVEELRGEQLETNDVREEYTRQLLDAVPSFAVLAEVDRIKFPEAETHRG